jgi:hypothetical protein
MPVTKQLIINDLNAHPVLSVLIYHKLQRAIND